MVLGAARVAKSRPAKPSMPATANNEVASKPLIPGRRIIKTPTNPRQIASQRRQPTVSPKKTTAPAVTTSGVACSIAEAKDNGASTIASVKNNRPETSATQRHNSGRVQNPGCQRVEPCARAMTAKIAMPPRPKKISTCPVGIAPATDLMIISSTAKAAIASAIKRLPRRVSRSI